MSEHLYFVDARSAFPHPDKEIIHSAGLDLWDSFRPAGAAPTKLPSWYGQETRILVSVTSAEQLLDEARTAGLTHLATYPDAEVAHVTVSPLGRRVNHSRRIVEDQTPLYIERP